MAFEIRDSVDGEAGTKESFALQVGEQPNGLPFLLPVMTVNGAKDGPTLFINAAMHGDETLGTEAVRQAWRLLDPEAIGGRLVMIPMANLAGVATRTRRNIIEMYPGPHDMNRVFPGNGHGVLTERIANRIMTDFVSASDYTFDIHCASVGGEWLPYTAMPAAGTQKFEDGVVEGSRKLAEAFGAPLILEDFNYPGSLVQSAQEAGIPASMVEFGVATQSTRAERIWGRTGVIRLAQAVGIHDGPIPMFDDAEPPAVPTPIIAREMTRIHSDRGGFLHRRKFIGDRVKEGDNLAVLMSLDGEEIANFDAPHDGVVVRSNTMGVVGTGDIVAFVARVASD
jgi:uncharacterized protein